MTVKILQWNVWYKEDADNIRKLVQDLNPDIFCAQEITTNSEINPKRDVPAEIAKAGGYQYFYQTCIKRDSLDMGNAIFSKFPITNKYTTYVQREDTENPGFERENRVYIESTLTINNTQLTVGTVHLSYIRQFQVNEQKKTEIDTLIHQITTRSQNYILTGDMNAEPDTYLTSQLEKYLKNIAPPYDEPTWTTKPFSHDNFQASTLDWRLDHVFGTADIRVISAQIIKTDFSDHLPVLVTVEV